MPDRGDAVASEGNKRQLSFRAARRCPVEGRVGARTPTPLPAGERNMIVEDKVKRAIEALSVSSSFQMVREHLIEPRIRELQKHSDNATDLLGIARAQGRKMELELLLERIDGNNIFSSGESTHRAENIGRRHLPS